MPMPEIRGQPTLDRSEQRIDWITAAYTPVPYSDGPICEKCWLLCGQVTAHKREVSRVQ